MATLKTLTPVHIGNGLTLNRDIDFVLEGGKVGIVDETKIFELIGGVENVNAWVAAIEKSTAILKWLREERGLTDVKAEQIAERLMPLRTNSNSTQLKTHYRTSMQGVCIPGSSLKGALKTAIWNDMTTKEWVEKLSLNNLVKTIRRGDEEKPKPDRKGNLMWDYSKLDSDLFGKNANEKSTRFLKVGDIHFPVTETEAHEIRILNKYRAIRRNDDDEWKFKPDQQMLIECIPANQSVSFELKLDTVHLDRNAKKHPENWPKQNVAYLEGGVDGFCKRVNDFTIKILDWDYADLKTEVDGQENEVVDSLLEAYTDLLDTAVSCKSNEFVIRVGGHSGWRFTTGGWAVDLEYNKNISDEDWYGLRKAIQVSRNNYSDMSLWPKTRKITEKGQVFGFMKVAL